MRARSLQCLWQLLVFLHVGLAVIDQAHAAFAHFEARQVHPVALTPGGTHLLALNSPDGRLSVFDVSSLSNPEPVLLAEIPVGLEPVSVAALNEEEAWVINEVSDSISIVSLTQAAVIATLPTGDEPADVVFAQGRAFVSCAGSRELRVYDTTSRALIQSIPLEGGAPRALAKDHDEAGILVAFQLSGNRTTVIPSRSAPPQPAPINTNLPAPPRTALIVAASDSRVPYNVVDHDVARIDVPSLRVSRYYSDIGTCLFDLRVKPGSSELWVANTEARNLVRFEPQLKGHVVDHRLTRVPSESEGPQVIDLNPGVDYGILPNPGAVASSLAQPTALVFSPDGAVVWVAAFGSDRVARMDTSLGTVLKSMDVRVPQIRLSGLQTAVARGPRGLALQASSRRLYVLNKLSNTLSVIRTDDDTLLLEVPVGSFDPTPVEVRLGRAVLFDARLSGNGLTSCTSCHLDADRDGLAWDLGNPAGEMGVVIGANLAIHETAPIPRRMHPMKGPMVTQTLRGLSPSQLLHWRGDRPTLAFFNETFRDLMGGVLQPDSDIAALQTYLNSLKHHPNPNRNPDNSLPATLNGGNPVRGLSLFSVHINHCMVCHAGPAGSDNNVDDLRNFGGTQPIKTAPLATVYQRALLNTSPGATNWTGFGLLHDGTGGRQSMPTVHFYELDLLSGTGFADVASFLLCFDTGAAPAVGRSLTVTRSNRATAAVQTELNLLKGQAEGTNVCDLVVNGVIHGESRAYRYDAGIGRFRSDQFLASPVTRDTLLDQLEQGDALTFAGTLPGCGARLGGDRDLNGVLDRDEPRPAASLQIVAPGHLRIEWPRQRVGWVLEFSGDPGFGWRAETAPRDPGDGHVDLVGIDSPADVRPRFYRFRRTW